MTIHLAYQKLLSRLYEVYDEREAANIADMVIEHVTGQRKIDRIVSKELLVNEDQQAQLAKITAGLLAHKPVQYVLAHAWFMEMKLRVNERTLIPRPETEELVDWILTDIKESGNSEVSMLDIGTGTGCIPIAVRKKISSVAVSAIDVSDEALQVAILNSIEQKVLVDFLHLDFLDRNEWNHLGRYHIIVSNPPYVAKSEQDSMRNSVLMHEPHIALFVPDEDPLLFYKAIAEFGKTHLKEGGKIYLEINEAMGEQVKQLFDNAGYHNVRIRKDMQGK